MQIFNGKVVGSKRPHIANPWQFDTYYDMLETAEPAAPAANTQRLYIDSTTHRPTFKSSTSAKIEAGIMIPYNKRWGAYQPTSPNAAVTVTNMGIQDGILTQHVPTGAGSPAITYDNTEGIVANFVSGAVAGNNAGLTSPTFGVGIGRRLWGMKLEGRFSISNTANGRLFFGFSSAAALPTAAPVLANADHGVLVGFTETGSGSTNWTIFHNDGSGAMVADNVSTGIAKDTGYHTIAINWAAGGTSIKINFDSTVQQTISTRIPTTATNLFFNLIAQASTTTAKTLLVDYVYIEAEK